MATSANLIIRIGADVADLQKKLGSAQGRLNKFGSGARKAGMGLTAGVTAPILGMAAVGMKAAIAMDTSMTEISAALKGVNKASGITAGGIAKTAASLEGMSGQDEIAIAKSGQLIASLGGLSKQGKGAADTLKWATSLTVDMAAKMGGEASSHALKLAKAMESPTKGLNAFTRMGVVFSDKEKKKIKALEGSGQKMKAQTIILGKLQGKFGGAAEAAGKTLPGQLNIAKDAAEDFLRSAMTPMIPMLKQGAVWLQKAGDWFNSLSPKVRKTGTAVALLAAVVGPLLIVLGMLATAVAAVGLPVLAVVAVVGVLAAAFVMAYRRSDKFRMIVHKVSAIVMKHKQILLGILGPVGLLVAGLITLYKRSSTFRAIVATVIAITKAWIAQTIAIATKIGAFVLKVGTAIAKSKTFQATVSLVKTAARLAAAQLANMAGDVKSVATWVGNAAEKISKKFAPQIAWVKKNAAAAFGPVKSVLSSIDDFLSGLISKLDRFLKALDKVPGGKGGKGKGKSTRSVGGGGGDDGGSAPRGAPMLAPGAAAVGFTNHQHFYGANVDQFAASRRAVFAFKTAGLTPA